MHDNLTTGNSIPTRVDPFSLVCGNPPDNNTNMTTTILPISLTMCQHDLCPPMVE